MTPKKRAVDVAEDAASVLCFDLHGDTVKRSRIKWLACDECLRRARRLKKLGLLEKPGDSVEGMLRGLGAGSKLTMMRDRRTILCQRRGDKGRYYAVAAAAALRKAIKAMVKK